MAQAKQSGWTKQDILNDRFGNSKALLKAKAVLESDEQSEEAFLGAQAVLLLQGLI
jgi:hypothetical protein